MSQAEELRRNGSPAGAVKKEGKTPPYRSRRHSSSTREEEQKVLDSFKNVRSDGIDLFVYGTLMNDRHVKLLLNHTVKSEPALLYNYMRVVPPGAFYFIVPQQGAVTTGRLLKGLSPEDIARIDAFEDEGNLYFRKIAVVRNSTNTRQRCMTYVGNIPSLQKAFGKDILFEDRYSLYLERKIDQLLETIDPTEHEITRRAMRELMGSAVDTLIDSHFGGNYICNYLMIQAFQDAKPPLLADVMKQEELLPYADNYIHFACKHIVLNQFMEKVRHHFPNAVRLSHKYFRHGLAILLGFLFYNRNARRIESLLREKELDKMVPGRLYRDYAILCLGVADEVYDKRMMRDICDEVESQWYSTPTPLGAELEFSHLGAGAVSADAGEDPFFDSFYYFNDFDLQRRTWRMGGHVDSHHNIYAGNDRRRGFFEYAFGRFNIVGDLSRPLFDCPWGMSLLINEAVKFLDIPPHSLHISMELSGQYKQITAEPHKFSDLACLLLLGGDIRKDENGILREMRIFNKELDTNMEDSLNFSSRKYHYCREDQTQEDAAEVMEYKFLRLRKEDTDYTGIIMALKGYQFGSNARPLTICPAGEKELPEQLFMREYAKHPKALTSGEIQSFVDIVEEGICEELGLKKPDARRRKFIDNIHFNLLEKNAFVRANEEP